MESETQAFSNLLLSAACFHSQGHLMTQGTAVAPAISSSLQEAGGKKGFDHSFIRRRPGSLHASLISFHCHNLLHFTGQGHVICNVSGHVPS